MIKYKCNISLFINNNLNNLRVLETVTYIFLVNQYKSYRKVDNGN
jgi:hypothetical protein